MLIKCPECLLQVSDKAESCPHCGFPIKGQEKALKRVRRTKYEHRRLPNGFGRITRIKGKYLRKPYRAMITALKDSYGKPIGKILGYFETYNDAYNALVEYNKNPYDLGANIMTVEDLYSVWSKWYFEKLTSDSSKRSITSAWAQCGSVYQLRVKDVRTRHIKGVMDTASTPNIKMRIKSLFNLMLDYAVEYEICDKNYARDFNVSEEISKEAENLKKDHIAFTEDELRVLWANTNMPWVKEILINIYSGWRPQELGKLVVDGNYMIGGMKTAAGKNRRVPIHSCIKTFIKEKKYKKYLIECNDSVTHIDNNLLTYDKYNKRFKKVIQDLHLNPDHRPHDCRKTFISMCKNSGVDEYAIKYMVGHKISDLTESTYTERDPDWLVREIEKIKRGR